MHKVILIPLLLAFVHLSYTWQKYECDTPFASHSTRPHANYEEAEGDVSSSQDSTSTEDSGMGTSVPTLWKDGLVKYKLDRSLSKTDVKHVNQAMNEYRRKTCIRFEKFLDTYDEDLVPYTTISTNSDICSYASECQTSEINFAMFGKHCRHVSSMIHALGHNLCLGHEHQRTDRNNYVSIDRSCEEDDDDKYRKENHPAKGIYNYASQMHESCGKCVKSKRGTPNTCGPQVSPGLSVMDADFLNSEYNCKGCYSHRWKLLDNLEPTDISNLAKFGQVDEDGNEVTPCRALIGIGKEVTVGAYDEKEKKCRLFFNNQSVDTTKAEVLTIPGGLLQEDNSAYQLISVDTKTMPAHLLKYAVPSGNSFDPYLKGYIAYYKSSSSGQSYVGKVWRKKSGDGLSPGKFFINNKEISKTKFYILVCGKVDHAVNATSTATPTESTTTPTSAGRTVGDLQTITKTIIFNGMTVKIEVDPNQIANEKSDTIDLTKINPTEYNSQTTRQQHDDMAEKQEQSTSSLNSIRRRSSRTSSNN